MNLEKIRANREKYLREEVPEKYHSMMRAAYNGSEEAAIWAYCFQCKQFDETAVRNCNERCPFMPLNPFRQNSICQ